MGFAITAADRKAVLDKAGALVFSEAHLEVASTWSSVMIPAVPTWIHTLDGRVQVDGPLLVEEVERVSGKKPVKSSPLGQNASDKPTSISRTWICHFDGPPPKLGFRVFDESGMAQAPKERRAPVLCQRCLGFHPTRGCSRAQACKNCGSTNYVEEDCRALTKCRNCGGPHRSDSRTCLARPTKNGARPSNEQLEVIRQYAQKAYGKALKEHRALQSQVVSEATVGGHPPAAAPDTAMSS